MAAVGDLNPSQLYSGLKAAITQHDTDFVTTNGNVTTNTTNIATNTANIATNTANIATNTANIATNTADIATNTANITTLQGQVGSVHPTWIWQTTSDNVTFTALGNIGGDSSAAGTFQPKFTAAPYQVLNNGDLGTTMPTPLVYNAGNGCLEVANTAQTGWYRITYTGIWQFREDGTGTKSVNPHQATTIPTTTDTSNGAFNFGISDGAHVINPQSYGIGSLVTTNATAVAGSIMTASITATGIFYLGVVGHKLYNVFSLGNVQQAPAAIGSDSVGLKLYVEFIQT